MALRGGTDLLIPHLPRANLRDGNRLCLATKFFMYFSLFWMSFAVDPLPAFLAPPLDPDATRALFNAGLLSGWLPRALQELRWATRFMATLAMAFFDMPFLNLLAVSYPACPPEEARTCKLDGIFGFCNISAGRKKKHKPGLGDMADPTALSLFIPAAICSRICSRKQSGVRLHGVSSVGHAAIAVRAFLPLDRTLASHLTGGPPVLGAPA